MKYILLLELFFLNFLNHTLASEINASSIMHIAVLPNDKITESYKKYILSAYHEIGYRVVFHEMVSLRAIKSIENKSSEIDAILILTESLGSKYSALLPVPVFLGNANLVLMCRKALICDRSVLQEKNNLIGVTATSFASIYLKNETVVSIQEVKSRNSLGQMLKRKRLDYILMINTKQYGNMANINVEEFSTFNIKPIRGFHYINKKHQQILPQLTKALKNAAEKLSVL